MELESSGSEFYFQWHITERCNLRCKHCYHESYKSQGELSPKELDRAFGEMEKALQKWQIAGSASLTGGEPFLRRDDLFRLCQMMDKSNHFNYYDMLTNGSLLNNADLSQFADLKKLRRVQLSLESVSQEGNDSIRGDGSFAATLLAIKTLKACGFQISVMTTVTKENRLEIPALIDLLAQEKVDTFAIERFIPEGAGAGMQNHVMSKEEVREVYESVHNIAMKERRIRILMYRPLFGLVDKDDCTVGAMCSVGANALTIMHDGTIFPCRRLPIPIGNILDDGLFKPWYDSDVLWSIRETNNLKGKCGSCELVPICRGCRAMAHWVSGDYLEEDPHCWKQMEPSIN